MDSTTAPEAYEVDCQDDGCGQVHEATFSHLSRNGGHRVYEAVCTSTPDWFSSFYTDEVVRPVTA